MERRIAKVMVFAGFYVASHYFLMLLQLDGVETFIFIPLIIIALSGSYLGVYEKGFAGAIGVLIAKGVELKLLSGYTLFEAVLVWAGGYMLSFRRKMASFGAPFVFVIYLLLYGVEFWKVIAGYFITCVILYILLGKGGDS